MTSPRPPQPGRSRRGAAPSDDGGAPLRRRPPRWRSATSFRRTIAAVVDLSVGVATTGLGFWVGLLRVPAWAQASGELPAWEQVAVRAATLPVSLWNVWIGLWVPWLVWITLVVLLSGRSLGQWVSGIRLVNAAGDPAPAVQRLAWGLAHVLWPASVGLLATAGWISRSRRGLPERVSATWAVTRPPPVRVPDQAGAPNAARSG